MKEGKAKQMTHTALHIYAVSVYRHYDNFKMH